MSVIKQSIVYSGTEYPCSSSVVDGRTMKLKSGITCWWNDGDAGTRKRPGAITSIVLHHTAGEGDGSAIFKTLIRRKLGVHFTINRDGVIIQHADLETATFHAGLANNFSVGIEIASRGVAPSLPGKKREEYDDEVRGRKRRFLRFYDSQTEATRSLCKDLCTLLNLPFTFPMDGKRVSRETLTKAELTAHKGLLGHLHISARKIDPSPHLLDDMVNPKDATA